MPLMLKLPRRPGSSNGLDTSAPQPSESYEGPGHPQGTGLPFKAAFFFCLKGFAMVQIAKPFFFVVNVHLSRHGPPCADHDV